MIGETLDDALKDQQSAIIAAVAARMRGDSDMAQVAEQRRLSEGELSGQVLGFYMQAIRSDLALGSTVAMEQNLQWLVRLREGHGLRFSDEAVTRCFVELAQEISDRLEPQEWRDEFIAYSSKVERLIREVFPSRGEA